MAKSKTTGATFTPEEVALLKGVQSNQGKVVLQKEEDRTARVAKKKGGEIVTSPATKDEMHENAIKKLAGNPDVPTSVKPQYEQQVRGAYNRAKAIDSTEQASSGKITPMIDVKTNALTDEQMKQYTPGVVDQALKAYEQSKLIQDLNGGFNIPKEKKGAGLWDKILNELTRQRPTGMFNDRSKSDIKKKADKIVNSAPVKADNTDFMDSQPEVSPTGQQIVKMGANLKPLMSPSSALAISDSKSHTKKVPQYRDEKGFVAPPIKRHAVEQIKDKFYNSEFYEYDEANKEFKVNIKNLDVAEKQLRNDITSYIESTDWAKLYKEKNTFGKGESAYAKKQVKQATIDKINSAPWLNDLNSFFNDDLTTDYTNPEIKDMIEMYQDVQQLLKETRSKNKDNAEVYSYKLDRTKIPVADREREVLGRAASGITSILPLVGDIVGDGAAGERAGNWMSNALVLGSDLVHNTPLSSMELAKFLDDPAQYMLQSTEGSEQSNSRIRDILSRKYGIESDEEARKVIKAVHEDSENWDNVGWDLAGESANLLGSFASPGGVYKNFMGLTGKTLAMAKGGLFANKYIQRLDDVLSVTDNVLTKGIKNKPLLQRMAAIGKFFGDARGQEIDGIAIPALRKIAGSYLDNVAALTVAGVASQLHDHGLTTEEIERGMQSNLILGATNRMAISALGRTMKGLTIMKHMGKQIPELGEKIAAKYATASLLSNVIMAAPQEAATRMYFGEEVKLDPQFVRGVAMGFILLQGDLQNRRAAMEVYKQAHNDYATIKERAKIYENNPLAIKVEPSLKETTGSKVSMAENADNIEVVDVEPDVLTEQPIDVAGAEPTDIPIPEKVIEDMPWDADVPPPSDTQRADMTQEEQIEQAQAARAIGKEEAQKEVIGEDEFVHTEPILDVVFNEETGAREFVANTYKIDTNWARGIETAMRTATNKEKGFVLNDLTSLIIGHDKDILTEPQVQVLNELFEKMGANTPIDFQGFVNLKDKTANTHSPAGYQDGKVVINTNYNKKKMLTPDDVVRTVIHEVGHAVTSPRLDPNSPMFDKAFYNAVESMKAEFMENVEVKPGDEKNRAILEHFDKFTADHARYKNYMKQNAKEFFAMTLDPVTRDLFKWYDELQQLRNVGSKKKPVTLREKIADKVSRTFWKEKTKSASVDKQRELMKFMWNDQPEPIKPQVIAVDDVSIIKKQGGSKKVDPLQTTIDMMPEGDTLDEDSFDNFTSVMNELYKDYEIPDDELAKNEVQETFSKLQHVFNQSSIKDVIKILNKLKPQEIRDKIMNTDFTMPGEWTDKSKQEYKAQLAQKALNMQRKPMFYLKRVGEYDPDEHDAIVDDLFQPRMVAGDSFGDKALTINDGRMQHIPVALSNLKTALVNDGIADDYGASILEALAECEIGTIVGEIKQDDTQKAYGSFGNQELYQNHNRIDLAKKGYILLDRSPGTRGVLQLWNEGKPIKPENAFKMASKIFQMQFYRYLNSEAGGKLVDRYGDLLSKMDLTEFVKWYLSLDKKADDRHKSTLPAMYPAEAWGESKEGQFKHQQFKKALTEELSAAKVNGTMEQTSVAKLRNDLLPIFENYIRNADGDPMKELLSYYYDGKDKNKGSDYEFLSAQVNDLYRSLLDAGMGARLIPYSETDFTQSKEVMKYENMLFDNAVNRFTDTELFKQFYSEFVTDGKYDEKKLRAGAMEYNANQDKVKANAGVLPQSIIDALIELDPTLATYLAKNMTDAVTIATNDVYSTMIQKGLGAKDKPWMMKTKYYELDGNGNHYIQKDGLYQKGILGPKLKTMFEGWGADTAYVSFPTASKGKGTYKVTYEPLTVEGFPEGLHVAKNADGTPVDSGMRAFAVGTMDKGNFKPDPALGQALFSHALQSLINGKYPDYMKRKVTVGGEGAMSLLSYAKAGKGGRHGALSMNALPQAARYHPQWAGAEGQQAYNIVKKYQDNIRNHEMGRVKDLLFLREYAESLYHPDEGFSIKPLAGKKQQQLGRAVDTLINNIVGDEISYASNNPYSDLVSREDLVKRLNSIVIRDKGKVIGVNLDKIGLLLGLSNVVASDRGMASKGFLPNPGMNTAYFYSMRNSIEAALKTQGRGFSATLLPDLGMDAEQSTMQYLEDQLLDIDGGMEDITKNLDAIDEQMALYHKLQAEYVDPKTGQLKPNKGGVYITATEAKKHKITLGQKVLGLFIPADSAHNITPFTVVGIIDGQGGMLASGKYLTKVLGKDYDKDSGHIVVAGEHIKQEDLDFLHTHLQNKGINKGIYKTEDSRLEGLSKKKSPKGTMLFEEIGLPSEAYRDMTINALTNHNVVRTHVGQGEIVKVKRMFSEFLQDDTGWTQDKQGNVYKNLKVIMGKEGTYHFKIGLPDEAVISRLTQAAVDTYNINNFDVLTAMRWAHIQGISLMHYDEGLGEPVYTDMGKDYIFDEQYGQQVSDAITKGLSIETGAYMDKLGRASSPTGMSDIYPGYVNSIKRRTNTRNRVYADLMRMFDSRVNKKDIKVATEDDADLIANAKHVMAIEKDITANDFIHAIDKFQGQDVAGIEQAAETNTAKSYPNMQEYKQFKWNRPNRTEGTDADKAMREVADGFIGEIAKENSSSMTSAKEISRKTDNEISREKSGTVFGGSDMAKVTMLARNSEFSGKSLAQDTKVAIDLIAKNGGTFVVGDMPGVDTPFIDYLEEIGAKYTVYGHGRLNVEGQGDVAGGNKAVSNTEIPLLYDKGYNSGKDAKFNQGKLNRDALYALRRAKEYNPNIILFVAERGGHNLAVINAALTLDIPLRIIKQDHFQTMYGNDQLQNVTRYIKTPQSTAEMAKNSIHNITIESLKNGVIPNVTAAIKDKVTDKVYNAIFGAENSVSAIMQDNLKGLMEGKTDFDTAAQAIMEFPDAYSPRESWQSVAQGTLFWEVFNQGHIRSGIPIGTKHYSYVDGVYYSLSTEGWKIYYPEDGKEQVKLLSKLFNANGTRADAKFNYSLLAGNKAVKVGQQYANGEAVKVQSATSGKWIKATVDHSVLNLNQISRSSTEMQELAGKIIGNVSKYVGSRIQVSPELISTGLLFNDIGKGVIINQKLPQEVRDSYVFQQAAYNKFNTANTAQVKKMMDELTSTDPMIVIRGMKTTNVEPSVGVDKEGKPSGRLVDAYLDGLSNATKEIGKPTDLEFTGDAMPGFGSVIENAFADDWKFYKKVMADAKELGYEDVVKLLEGDMDKIGATNFNKLLQEIVAPMAKKLFDETGIEQQHQDYFMKQLQEQYLFDNIAKLNDWYGNRNIADPSKPSRQIIKTSLDAFAAQSLLSMRKAINNFATQANAGILPRDFSFFKSWVRESIINDTASMGQKVVYNPTYEIIAIPRVVNGEALIGDVATVGDIPDSKYAGHFGPRVLHQAIVNNVLPLKFIGMTKNSIIAKLREYARDDKFGLGVNLATLSYVNSIPELLMDLPPEFTADIQSNIMDKVDQTVFTTSWGMNEETQATINVYGNEVFDLFSMPRMNDLKTLLYNEYASKLSEAGVIDTTQNAIKAHKLSDGVVAYMRAKALAHVTNTSLVGLEQMLVNYRDNLWRKNGEEDNISTYMINQSIEDIKAFRDILVPAPKSSEIPDAPVEIVTDRMMQNQRLSEFHDEMARMASLFKRLAIPTRSKMMELDMFKKYIDQTAKVENKMYKDYALDWATVLDEQAQGAMPPKQIKSLAYGLFKGLIDELQPMFETMDMGSEQSLTMTNRIAASYVDELLGGIQVEVTSEKGVTTEEMFPPEFRKQLAENIVTDVNAWVRQNAERVGEFYDMLHAIHHPDYTVPRGELILRGAVTNADGEIVTGAGHAYKLGRKANSIINQLIKKYKKELHQRGQMKEYFGNEFISTETAYAREMDMDALTEAIIMRNDQLYNREQTLTEDMYDQSTDGFNREVEKLLAKAMSFVDGAALKDYLDSGDDTTIAGNHIKTALSEHLGTRVFYNDKYSGAEVFDDSSPIADGTSVIAYVQHSSLANSPGSIPKFDLVTGVSLGIVTRTHRIKNEDGGYTEKDVRYYTMMRLDNGQFIQVKQDMLDSVAVGNSPNPKYGNNIAKVIADHAAEVRAIAKSIVVEEITRTYFDNEEKKTYKTYRSSIENGQDRSLYAMNRAIGKAVENSSAYKMMKFKQGAFQSVVMTTYGALGKMIKSGSYITGGLAAGIATGGVAPVAAGFGMAAFTSMNILFKLIRGALRNATSLGAAAFMNPHSLTFIDDTQPNHKQVAYKFAQALGVNRVISGASAALKGVTRSTDDKGATPLTKSQTRALETATESNAITQAGELMNDVFTKFGEFAVDGEGTQTWVRKKLNSIINFDNKYYAASDARKASKYAEKAQEAIKDIESYATFLFDKTSGKITRQAAEAHLATLMGELDALNAKYETKGVPLVKAEIVMDNNLPRVMITVGGENISELDRARVSLMDMMTYYATAGGLMQKSEISSAIAAFNVNETNRRKTLEQLKAKDADFPPILMYNLLKQSVDLTIGNYERSLDQKKFGKALLNLFSRWAHEKVVNQVVNTFDRGATFKAMTAMMANDPAVQKFQKLGLIPYGEYLLSNGYQELRAMAGLGFVQSTLFNPKVLPLLIGSIATVLTGLLNATDEGEEMFYENMGIGNAIGAYFTAMANGAAILYRMFFEGYKNPQQATGEATTVVKGVQSVTSGFTGFGGQASAENAIILTYLGIRQLARDMDMVEDAHKQEKGDWGYTSPYTLREVEGTMQKRLDKAMKTASQFNPWLHSAYETWDSYKLLSKEKK